MGVGGHLSVAMTVIQLQCVQTSMALKNKSVFTDSNDTGIQYIKSQASVLDLHVPVVDTIQQIFNKLLVFSVKMLNNITISISCGKHKLKQYAKLLKKSFWHFLLSLWTYWTDSAFFCSCFFRPSSMSSSVRTGSKGQGFPLIISCFATVQHSLGI